MSEIPFKKHVVEWTNEKVIRFWDNFATDDDIMEHSFARQVGSAILAITRNYIQKDGKNLDYGCGGGDLMEYLYQEGIHCAGLDTSNGSLDTVNKRFEGNKYFDGAILSEGLPVKRIEDDAYDFMYSIETVEHLFPETLPDHAAEFARILKSGGYAFISTPHNENLQKQSVMCPDCGGVFHRVQHINTFTVASLSSVMEEAGFETVLCKATLLEPASGKAILKKIGRRLLGIKEIQPHLIYLGRRK